MTTVGDSLVSRVTLYMVATNIGVLAIEEIQAWGDSGSRKKHLVIVLSDDTS